MTRPNNLKRLTLLTGTALAMSVSAGTSLASDANPFGMNDLPHGFQVAAEGKCGEAKCGANKAKAAESKCGANKAKAAESKSGANREKTSEGKCGAGKTKTTEGKCGGKK